MLTGPGFVSLIVLSYTPRSDDYTKADQHILCFEKNDIGNWALRLTPQAQVGLSHRLNLVVEADCVLATFQEKLAKMFRKATKCSLILFIYSCLFY